MLSMCACKMHSKLDAFIEIHYSWSKLSPGDFMLNVDTGHDEVIGSFSVGVVIREHDGIVRAASTCGIRCSGSVLYANSMLFFMV